MSTSDDLTRLLAQLKTSASPLQRMKILGRAWRTLRRLSPKARRDLAARVGIDNAEDVLEQLAGKDRKLSPAALLAALEAVRGTSAEDLQRTLSDLKRPAGRKALLDKGLDLLAGGPDDDVAVALSPAPPTALDAVTLRSETTVDPPPPTRRREPSVAKTGGAGVAGAVAVAAAGTKRPETPAQRHATVRKRQEAAASKASRSKPQKPVAKPVESVPQRARHDRWAPRESAKPAAAEPAPAGDSRLVETLAGTDRLSVRFRTLHDRIDEARGMSETQLRRLIETFPDGWSRRRALCALLDRRIPADLHRAIYLIEGLESRLSQRWCISRILHAWPLSEREREALLTRRGAFIRRAG